MVHFAVIGAGINGLSSAIALQDAFPDANVTIIADHFSPNTTGDVAAGYFNRQLNPRHPHTKEWCEETYTFLLSLATSNLASETSAQIVYTHMLCAPELLNAWLKSGPVVRELTKHELTLYVPGKCGVVYMTVCVDTPIFLSWLRKKFESKGGNTVQKAVRDISELKDYDVIVNCSGLGSRDLFKDKEIVPIRGQLYKVDAPWIKYAVFDYTIRDKPSYVLPGQNYVTVGGTYEYDNNNTEVNKQDSIDIWNNGIKTMPQLQGAKILREEVGLRPYRAAIRLELEYCDIYDGSTKPVVHNYGHGGAGYCTFIGCAREVTEIVSKLQLHKQ